MHGTPAYMLHRHCRCYLAGPRQLAIAVPDLAVEAISVGVNDDALAGACSCCCNWCLGTRCTAFPAGGPFPPPPLLLLHATTGS